MSERQRAMHRWGMGAQPPESGMSERQRAMHRWGMGAQPPESGMSERQRAMHLPTMDVAARLARLREAYPHASCDALLLTNLVNIRYLTGFTGSAAMLVVLPDDAVLVTDGRYTFQSAEQLAAAGVEARIEVGTLSGQKDAVVQACKGVKRVGLEATNVTWARQRMF